MALVRCGKCGKIVSSAARSCPYCKPGTSGRVVRQTGKPAARPRRLSTWLGIGTVACGAAIAAWLVRPEQVQTEAEYPISTPASTAMDAEPAPKSGDRHRAAMTVAIAASVKKSLPDPNALVWERMSANDNASVVCLEYKVRTAAGEYRHTHFSYVNGRTSEHVDDWRRHCTAKTLNDMAHLMDAN